MVSLDKFAVFYIICTDCTEGKMSLKSFTKKIGAVIPKVIVSYERKISDGEYGSIGGSLHVEFSLPPKGDPDEILDAAYDEVKEKATALFKPSFMAVKKTHVEISAPELPLEPEVQIPNEDPGWCPIHECEMKRREKDGQVWYSHKTKDGWCNGK